MDKVEIGIKAGNGGNGAATFRREKFVPFGGPDGGDGGAGGSIYIVGDRNSNDLSFFRHKRSFRAADGGNGDKQKMYGRKGDDLEINVPLGTIVYKHVENGESILADIVEHDQRVLAAQGGSGGKGNVHFATSTNQAPKKATPGQRGEESLLLLDLKLIADVGIIGFPNAGKSTLISVMSSARPKIASYPFTTIEPVLGVVRVNDQDITLVEIPGLIRDAHLGKGLGHEFLRHAERTRLFVHVIDGSVENIEINFRDINRELELFNRELALKPQIVAINKLDLPEVAARVDTIKEVFSTLGQEVYFISGMNRQGIAELLLAISSNLSKLPPRNVDPGTPVKIFRPQPREKRE